MLPISNSGQPKESIFNQWATRIFKTCNTWLFSRGHWPLFSLRLSNKKWQQPTQQLSCVSESKLYQFFFVGSAKHIFWCDTVLIVCMCQKMQKVENHCPKGSDYPLVQHFITELQTIRENYFLVNGYTM